MPTEQSTTADSEFLTGRLATTVLAVGYMAVGIGFWAGLLTGWFRLLVAALAGTVVLVAVSLYIAVKREGLVTAENKLFAAFALLATGLMLALFEFTDASGGVVFALCLAVATVPPYLILNHTDYGRPT
ncbi:hypothetical protein [Natronorubrum sp. DTA28]|uniref:hypothetical protein n=1 Tax=Natronorubrum sp. DTA28 TaxID=3447019 RepID=UPI003F86E70A